MNRQRELLSKLLFEKPMFHGRENAGTQNYRIADEVLHWIADTMPPGGTSLETGCGYSTVAFGCVSSKHIVISPFLQEHRKIREWCLLQGEELANIDYVVAESQQVIHSMIIANLDVVLIDGDHAFPAPFLDWYYVADNIREGGYLIVDDTQIKTGEILSDFLRSETERWSVTQVYEKTAIFRKKTAKKVAKGVPWTSQPFCEVKTISA